MEFHDLSMTNVIFYDFPGLENAHLKSQEVWEALLTAVCTWELWAFQKLEVFSEDFQHRAVVVHRTCHSVQTTHVPVCTLQFLVKYQIIQSPPNTTIYVHLHANQQWLSFTIMVQINNRWECICWIMLAYTVGTVNNIWRLHQKQKKKENN